MRNKAFAKSQAAIGLSAALFIAGGLAGQLQAAVVSVEVSSAKGKPTAGGTLTNVVTEAGLKLDGGNDINWIWALMSRSEKDIDVDPDKGEGETGTVTEKKFDFTNAGTPKPRDFDGFEAEAKTKWSVIEAAGRGSSRRTIGNKLKVKAEIAIKGEIDVPKKGAKVVDAEYEGTATVSDPFYITPEDIADSGLDISSFDLFIPFTIDAFSFTGTTDAYFSYFFETADGRSTIFDLEAGPLAPPVLSFDPTLTYYLLDDIDNDPDFATDTPLDMAAFALDIGAMLSSTGSIGAGFSLGVLIEDLDLGGKVLANGASVAHGFESGTGAYKIEIGYVPLPPALWLSVAAFSLLAGVARRPDLAWNKPK